MKRFLITALSCAVTLASGANLKPITDETQLQTIIASKDKVTIVDFWAEWCPSCKVVKKSLSKVASSFADKANSYVQTL